MKIKRKIELTEKEATNLQWVLEWYDCNNETLKENGIDVDQDLYWIIEDILSEATNKPIQDYTNSEKEYQEVKKKVEGD